MVLDTLPMRAGGTEDDANIRTEVDLSNEATGPLSTSVVRVTSVFVRFNPDTESTSRFVSLKAYDSTGEVILINNDKYLIFIKRQIYHLK